VTAPVYPTLEEALHLHRLLIERFAGDAGVRDPGLLESALHRPRSGYYASLSEQAAALCQSLARNHAFVDGNKRMAFALAAVFLRLNGWRLETTADDAEAFIGERVIGGHAEIEEMRTWIEAHLVQLERG